MLFDNDVVTYGKAEACALSSRLCRKKRIEHPFLHVRFNSGAIVADRDLDAVAKILR